jgi:predicted lactoylglutathione lyase
MIGYVTLGTNDKPRAEKFYDELLKELGASRTWQNDRFTAYSIAEDKPSIMLAVPHDGKPATIGNGSMVGIYASSPEKVNALYNKAISLGATDEGRPGPRGDGGFYCGYFRDLDGNKLNAFCMLTKK